MSSNGIDDVELCCMDDNENQNIKNYDVNSSDNNNPPDYVLVYESEKNEDFEDIEICEMSNNDLDLHSINSDPNRLTASDKRNIYLANLINEGFELKQFKNSDGKRQATYILVYAPENKLCETAEKTRFKIRIEDCKIELPDIASKLYDCLTKPFKLPNGLSDLKQRDYFSVPFSFKLKERIENYGGCSFGKMLSSKDRSLLTHEFLSQISFTKLTSIEGAASNDTNIGIKRLLHDHSFTAAYPLHEEFPQFDSLDEENLREILLDHWAKPVNIFKFQPLHHIKEYFGEKVAFYFAWLGFYTTWLFFPSIIGVFVFIYGLVTLQKDIPSREICDRNGTGNLTVCMLCSKNEVCRYWKLSDSCLYSKIGYVFDNPATIFFSFVMAVWTVLFIEIWKRKQSELQYEWDVVNFEGKYDAIRPEYERKVKHTRLNHYTQREELFVPYKTMFANYSASLSAVLLMLSLTLALIIGVIIYRVTVLNLLSKKRWNRSFSIYVVDTTAAIINLIFILILNKVYAKLAIFLTDIELHRTDSLYEKSLTIKMYLFQFVNYYSSVFYVAFFKGKVYSREYWFFEPCDPSGCLSELCVQLAVIMVGQQIIDQITEVIIPAILNCISKKKHAKTESCEKFRWEKDYDLMSWTNTSLFDEYFEMVIQYGFITLFTVAFPLGPLCAFINNIIEIRIDANKFLMQSKRRVAKKAQSIGIWLNILSTVSMLGVITNGFIIAFTSEFIPRLVYQITKNKKDLTGFVNYTILELDHTDFDICVYRGYETADKYQILVGRLIFIVVFEHLTFLLVIVLRLLIPDMPKNVQEKIENENSIVQRIIWQTKSD